MKDTGDGVGFVAAAGEHVDVTLIDSNGAVHTAPTGTLHDRRCEHERQRSVHDHLHARTDAGKVTGHARSTLSVGGSAAFTVQTDGTVAELRRRGEDVREREDRDRSGRDERGRGSRTRSR